MDRHGPSFRDSSTSRVREPWSYNHSTPDPLTCGFSWPPRTYSCSFCKREFRSAQALGGHMNVHRRDRARLRQSPPWDLPSPNSNPNPNPNPPGVPNLNSTPPPSRALTSLMTPLGRRSSSSSSTSSAEVEFKGVNAVKAFFCVEELKVMMEEGVGEVGRERDVMTLDLEIGLCGGLKEELDLELRLGYT